MKKYFPYLEKSFPLLKTVLSDTWKNSFYGEKNTPSHNPGNPMP